MSGEETRLRLLAIVRDHPGIHPSRLMREADLAWGTIQHHLQVLQRDGLVRSRREGRVCRLFSSQVSPSQEESLAVQHDELTLGLRQRLDQDPGMSIRALSMELGRSRATIRQHLSRMRSAELGPEAPARGQDPLLQELRQVRMALDPMQAGLAPSAQPEGHPRWPGQRGGQDRLAAGGPAAPGPGTEGL